MKRILQIALVFTWLFSITGVVVSKHYCGPFLKNIQLGESKLHCCMDGADEPEGCCENTTEFRSIEGDFLKIEKKSVVSPLLFVLYSVELPSFVQLDLRPSGVAFLSDTDTGPPLSGLPVYLAVRSLLI